MTIVIDASVTLAWLFDDETTDEIDGLFDTIAESQAVVPGLWSLEVASGLRMAHRRKRIDLVFRDKAIARLRRLPILHDPDTATAAWKATLTLSDRHDLTPYDAAYLELALRLRLPIATLDGELASAAEVEGVSNYGRSAPGA